MSVYKNSFYYLMKLVFCIIVYLNSQYKYFNSINDSKVKLIISAHVSISWRKRKTKMKNFDKKLSRPITLPIINNNKLKT